MPLPALPHALEHTHLLVCPVPAYAQALPLTLIRTGSDA